MMDKYSWKQMKDIIILITLLAISVFSLQAQSKTEPLSSWKTISGCNVSLYGPNDVEITKDSSVDTCEQSYQSKNIIIHITVTEWNIGGEYSDWLEYCLVKSKINTKPAEIVTSFKPKSSENEVYENDGFDYAAMLLVPKFSRKGDNLLIRTWSKTSEEREKAIKILQSVKFNWK
jgi:hypothetical protein